MTSRDSNSSSTSTKEVPDDDYEKGKKIFKKRCARCHTITQTRSHVGPPLNGVMGRLAGTVPGYPYSQSIRRYAVVWNKETLDEYLANPRKYIPGTKMWFGGVRRALERAYLIKFIEVESAKTPI
ncbi:unnamed protein product [Cylicocyclus nassatus]|uniref:Cytochrome c domain-containing protein n=1 Tax=Cylicocyclus nassatus TaxID=53992 RepID=A0AA36DLF5_CYLNA|nr:unnamed protein product [Cylicocyclus nassatus]